jgi:hypothetical protein
MEATTATISTASGRFGNPPSSFPETPHVGFVFVDPRLQLLVGEL